MARDADGIIQIVYANSGDVGLGGLDLNELWSSTYSTPGGALPQRIQFNQLWKNISALAVEINQKGPYLDYSALIDYAVGSMVKGSDGIDYQCRVVNGPSSIVVDPVGNPDEWKVGSTNPTLVVGADGDIDGNRTFQIAHATNSIMEVSTGGTGGQGSTRRSLGIENSTSNDFIEINAFDHDTSLGIKLRLNDGGGEVGIGKIPADGISLDVLGDIEASGSILDNGKKLVPDSLSYEDILTGQTINTATSNYNLINLGPLSVGDSFIVSYMMTGTKATPETGLHTSITESGAGVMSSPAGTNALQNQSFHDGAGIRQTCFSSVCTVTTAGACTLQVSSFVEAGGGSYTSATMGLRVDFLRKA